MPKVVSRANEVSMPEAVSRAYMVLELMKAHALLPEDPEILAWISSVKKDRNIWAMLP